MHIWAWADLSKLAYVMELQIKELLKADVKARCLHGEFNNEKQPHGRQIQYCIWDT